MSFTVLIVEDEDNARTFFSSLLTSNGYEVAEAGNLEEAYKQIEHGKADIILLDVLLPDGSGLSLLDYVVPLTTRPPIILMTGHGDIDMAVEAMKNGAMDFLQKPIQFEQLEKSIRRAGEIVAMRRELAQFRKAQQQLDYIVGESTMMKNLFDQAQRAASASVSVLITGETGTGKEVLARAIHQMGPRADKPFIPVDCGAIQSTVFESELFGHEPGAFTSAEKRKHGLMEVADEGILFLDEISSLPVDIQVKLLRALTERSFRRVGGTNLIMVDVQVLAASNRILQQMIEAKEFRDDLYYRLKVVDLHIPPLRDHKEDIPELVGLHIRKNNPRFGKNIIDVTPRAMEVLFAHDWPGNIRELNNVIDHGMTFCDEAAIDLPHLPYELIEKYTRPN
jgi:two-component system response regulator AtoC